MEQIQFIAEKEMTAKLLKQFSIRAFLYSLLYLGVIAILFIFSLYLTRAGNFGLILSILLITAINVLFLLVLSRLATTEAFYGVNTTSAPRKSLDRILTAISVPLFIITAVFSFLDIIFLHSFFDISNGYTLTSIATFLSVLVLNICILLFIVNFYEKRILKKYLIIE